MESFAKIHVALIGLVLMVLGAATMFVPMIFSEIYGLKLTTPDAVGAIRAIIGGSEMGLGAFFVFGGRLGASILVRALVGAFLFGGLVFSRLIHLIIVREASGAMIIETGLEAIAFVGFIIIVRNGEQNPKAEQNA